MRVWIIKVGESIPFENTNVRPMRAGILAKMLSESGHDVTWWTSSVNHFTKTIYPQSASEDCTLPCGTKLIFLKSILYKKNISLRRWINHFGEANDFKKKASLHHKPDIVICCFPVLELSYSVINFCKKNKIPVIIDIRDLYPDVFITLFPDFLKPLAKIMLYPLSLMTKRIMKKATGLTAISNAYLKWGLDHAKRDQQKHDGIFPLAYPKPEKQIVPNTQFTEKFDKLKNKKIIFYLGSFISSIDLETVIKSAALLKKKHKDEFHFILSGDGGYREQWESLAKGLDNITFTGWVDFPQIHWLAHQSWAGLGAYKKDALMSLPNKIFEYMSFGLPIISSLPGETKEFIENNGYGLYYEAGNPESLIASIERLEAHPYNMGQSGLKDYLEKYSPPIVYGNMITHALQIATEKKEL